MASPNPFLQFVPNRVESVLRRLAASRWCNRIPVSVTAVESTREHRSLADVRGEPRGPVAVGSAWGRLFDQRWFHIELPEPSASEPRYLEWRDQGEATLHVDGVPYYGFDVAHRRVALPTHATEVWIEGYCCQSAVWHPDATGLSPAGSVFGGAFLVRRDEVVWAAWNELSVLCDVMLALRTAQEPALLAPCRFGQQPAVDRAMPIYRKVLHQLEQALDAHEREGLEALTKHLESTRVALRDERPVVRAVLTGHAHIDLVWLWPERMGEAKAVHTFATVDRLISMYPEFRFAYSQPASYRAVERRAPALASAVRRHIEQGSWQATGALEVESDTMLPCGEALARGFVLGQAEFERLAGSPSRLLWLPDVFGYAVCLPQLMCLAGVEWFFTTKLTWSAVNRFPYSSFVWRGNDGSEVVAHVTQNVGYNNRLELAELNANARGHAQSHLHDEFLHPTGYGDGGGGPTEEMCERARRLSGLAGTPALEWAHPETFFARLAEHREHLPVHQGECYLEYHRGTYTTHGDLKAAYRGLERALQVREAVAVAAGSSPELTPVWRRLVFAQFHDYLPGSAIAEVYAEGVPELNGLAQKQLAAAAAELAGTQGEWHAFNPLALPWTGWIAGPNATAPRWMELAPLSSASFKSALASPQRVVVAGQTLRNERVYAELAADGTLGALVIDGRPLALLPGAGQPVLFPDRPANYDAWDIDRHSLELGEPVKTPVTWSTTADSEQGAMLTVSRRLGRSSSLAVRYELRAGEAVLRITAEVDWREEHALLRLNFPTDYRGQQARFGAPFGSVLRGQLPGDPRVEAQWEVPGSRWAAVFADAERDGLAIISEAKYGFSARSGELTVSLLRAAGVTGNDDPLYAAPPGLSRYQPESTFSDQGPQVIRLALGAYNAIGATADHPAALAETLFAEPVVYCGAPISAGLVALDDAPTLLPCWAQPLGGGDWLLRLHEVSGQRGRARLTLTPSWTARACGLDGNPRGVDLVEFDYGAYQIVSVRLSSKGFNCA